MTAIYDNPASAPVANGAARELRSHHDNDEYGSEKKG